MRAEKTVNVNGKSVTVKELRAADVIQLIEGKDDDGTRVLAGVMAGMPSDVRKLMSKGVDLSVEEFEDLVEGVNGFTVIEKAFREVNADFFAFLPLRISNILANAEAMESQVARSLKQRASSSRKAT